ncbi:MAG: N-6 DNA methylase [Flavobacteriales bacterium]|nr:N-6 DNA methylase [Flavobacteriales bacterium]
MRQASLIDVIEFILRQNGGPTSAEDIHHRLSELEILEKRSGVGPIDILYRAKAEPAVFVIDDQDRIWLTKEQLTDLAPLFRKRLWQLRDTMRAFPEPGIDLTMAVLAYAIVAKKPEESPELWAKGRFEGECLQQVIERIAKRFPVGMGPVVDYIRNTSWEYHLDIDHWLLFAELVKPDPLEVIKVMREFGNASPTGGFTVPWPIASLMGSLLGDGMIEDLLDMTVDAGALPVVVTGRGGNVGRLTGYYSDPVGSMLAQLELDLVGLTVRSEPFTASLLDDREYDRILAVPPMGRMRNPFPLGGKTTDAPTIYLERLLGLLQATGRAVVMVPVNVLFSSSTPIKRLREALVHADHLDAVIELPQGVLRPYAGVNTAILVIDKYKPIERRGKVFMLRAKLDDAGGRSTTSLDQALVKAGALSKSRLEEAGISQVITGRSIELRTFDLTPAKYLDSLREISITSRSPEGHLVTLDEVIVRQRFQSVRVGDSPKLNALPNAPMFVRVSDLAKDPSYPFLRMRSTEKIKGTVKLIDRDAILVSQAFNRLSPTLFRFKDRAVALGQHVMALVPDTSRVLLITWCANSRNPMSSSRSGHFARGHDPALHRGGPPWYSHPTHTQSRAAKGGC